MAIPATPQNVVLQTGNGQNLLSWAQSAGALSYSIQRSSDPTFSTGVSFFSTTALQYLDTAVTLGIPYYYQVAGATVLPAQAQATITFAGQPDPGDTVSIANSTFTAVASGAGANQFNIAASVLQTITNLAGAITTALPNIVVISSTVPATSTVLIISAATVGPEGNGLQFSSSLTNTTSTNFTGGTLGSYGPYSTPLGVVPATTGEMSLGALRLASQQRADRVNSQFVTTQEWNFFINQAMFELYDLLVTCYDDYFLAPGAQFISDGVTYLYPLPDGVATFLDNAGNPFVPPPFYKLQGVDLAINTANNAYVTVNKFDFIQRNSYIYPNSASSIYGVFNMQYRLMGNAIEFIPTPSAGQKVRLWYIPRMTQLLLDTDLTMQGVSGWLQYVIIRAAKYALDKEESDTTKLDEELLFLKGRIEESAQNRDAGQADTISDTRGTRGWGGFGGNWGSPVGGW